MFAFVIIDRPIDRETSIGKKDPLTIYTTFGTFGTQHNHSTASGRSRYKIRVSNGKSPITRTRN